MSSVIVHLWLVTQHLDALDSIQFNSNLFHSEVKTTLQKLTSKEKYSQLFLHTKILKMLISESGADPQAT